MGTGYALKEIPEEVYKFVLKEQNKIKNELGKTRYSFDLVVYKLLLELKEIREGKK